MVWFAFQKTETEPHFSAHHNPNFYYDMKYAPYSKECKVVAHSVYTKVFTPASAT